MRDLAHIPAAETATPALEAQGIRVIRRGETLLDVSDLPIRQGRVTVVMGANGAGKSLLLRVLHGLVRPCKGRVLGEGRQAMVFQKPVLLRRSVLANLRFAMRAAGLGRKAARAEAEAALARAGLEALAARPARLLSGGQQQRLALARALALRPEILFLDEPTASLDAAATHAIEAQIRAARDAGVSVVLVTHDAGQAGRLGEDAVFLHKGRVAERGPMGRFLASPESAVAQAWREGRLYLD